MSRHNKKGTMLTVSRLSAGATRGWVSSGDEVTRCALGRAGSRACKREGDGATPIGTWTLERVLYRADRLLRPRTGLPIDVIRSYDGWCDAPADKNYNRAVSLPYPASAERFWRDDHVYDLVVILSHNRRPRMRGCGSAIFIHLARPGYTPTEGCIALAERDLRRLLAVCGRGSVIRIRP
jgi:L,D-peptidoglycan transpeptidase YkuD (ErfK/YbiS/YcfS/YnhG family)